MKFSVFCRHDDFSKQLGSEMVHILGQRKNWNFNDEQPELVIYIGGDGTLLRAIHRYEASLDQMAFCAIHTGTLGFFTDYTKDEITQFLDDLSTKEPEIEEHPLIEAVLEDGTIYRALNEIRIGSFLNTVHYDLYVDHEYFESVSCSGICICTQAGSTGANRALNGAVVEDGLEIMELTQIMPVSHINHHSLVSPYIMRKDRVIEIKGKSLEESILCYDHLETPKLAGIQSATIRMSKHVVRLARFRPYSYLKRLRNLF